MENSFEPPPLEEAVEKSLQARRIFLVTLSVAGLFYRCQCPTFVRQIHKCYRERTEQLEYAATQVSFVQVSRKSRRAHFLTNASYSNVFKEASDPVVVSYYAMDLLSPYCALLCRLNVERQTSIAASMIGTGELFWPN